MERRSFLALLPALSACTPSLGAFDTLAPRDRGTRRIVRDAPYGAQARQKLDLYAPSARDGGALPILVFVHGGSWRNGDKSDYNFMGAALAAQGFLTAIPNYRLVPQARFPDFIEDGALALRWVADNAATYGGDASRIVLVGHSAGAYNVMMIALDRRYAQSAGVDASRIKGAVGLAGPYDFLPFDVDATRDAFGAAPDQSLTQPVTFARADAPPLLLLWGEDDTTVGPRNIQALERAMRAAGGAVEAKTYPGVDHIEIMLALSRPFRGLAPVMSDVVSFARRVAV
jgi:acetyl esterase/lipase